MKKFTSCICSNRVGEIFFLPSHTTVRAVRHTAVQHNFKACRSI